MMGIRTRANTRVFGNQIGFSDHPFEPELHRNAQGLQDICKSEHAPNSLALVDGGYIGNNRSADEPAVRRSCAST